MTWHRVTKFDARAVALADGHYSRRKPGSPQFMPPGQTIVLLHSSGRAVFGWWRPDPKSGIRQMNGLDGWTCTIFRNNGGGSLIGSDPRGRGGSLRACRRLRPGWATDIRLGREDSLAQPGLLLQARRMVGSPDEAEERRQKEDAALQAVAR